MYEYAALLSSFLLQHRVAMLHKEDSQFQGNGIIEIVGETEGIVHVVVRGS